MIKRSKSRLVVILGALVILAIKWIIRPNCIHCPGAVKYFLGIAPNLLGSFLLPFGCHWLLWRFVNIGQAYSLKIFLYASFLLLVLNELLQLIPVFGRTFDYSDILASAIGLCAAYLICNNRLVYRDISYLPTQLL